MDPNLRLPYITICLTYLYYILLLLAYKFFPLTMNKGGGFNIWE